VNARSSAPDGACLFAVSLAAIVWFAYLIDHVGMQATCGHRDEGKKVP
jgi:hypothetical protein